MNGWDSLERHLQYDYKYPYITKTGKLVYVRGLAGYMKRELQENEGLRTWWEQKQAGIEEVKDHE